MQNYKFLLPQVSSAFFYAFNPKDFPNEYKSVKQVLKTFFLAATSKFHETCGLAETWNLNNCINKYAMKVTRNMSKVVS